MKTLPKKEEKTELLELSLSSQLGLDLNVGLNQLRAFLKVQCAFRVCLKGRILIPLYHYNDVEDLYMEI